MENQRRTGRELNSAQTTERSISKKYRKVIWNPFIAGIKRYELIAEGDRVAVLVTDRNDSLLLGVMVKMLVRYSDFPFEAVFFAPSHSEAERKAKLTEAAAFLGIPLIFFEAGENTLLSFFETAEKSGCAKAAVCDTADDVCIETVSSMLFAGELRGLMPKEKLFGFKNIILIRPLFCVEEDAVRAWIRYNGISFFPEETPRDSTRAETEELLRRLKKKHPDLSKCIFNSVHSLHRDTFPGYIADGNRHSFLERYDSEEANEEGTE